MGNGVQRVALGVLVVMLLASSLAAVTAGARVSSTPNYTLLGYVEGPGGVPVPAGVTVDLISSATHQTYSTTTATASGQFSFTTGSTGSALAPGWWGVWVPPQSNVTLNGAPYAVLPADQNPQYAYENTSELVNSVPVTISGVQTVQYNATINGTVKYNGQDQGRAQISLLDPIYNGFVLAKNVSQTARTNGTTIGWYNLSVPWGTWVMETYLPGSPGTFNYTEVTVAKGFTTVNPVLSSSKGYLVWGFGKLASGANVPSGGNVTVFDPQTGYIYSEVTSPGGFYSVGLSVPGTYDVLLSFVGYSTAWFSVTVSGANPTGGTNPHDVVVAPIAPQASYGTTLDWSKGFGKLTINTSATIMNDSVFPDLANASAGQLWAQLALDWQHNLSFSSANLATVESWVNSSGPFFPAGQSDASVNSSVYGQPSNDSFTASSTCSGSCGLTSPAWIKLHWTESYNVTPTPKLPTNSKSYSFSFNFRHPTNDQTFNYSVLLPAGYVLASNAVVPSQTALVPNGKGGTWTSFTLVSKPSTNPSGTANFNAVKYGNVTAAVNISSSEFTWSEKNVLNSSHTNYTAVAGVGENLTFTALNSTFPSNTNGTLYTWNFGDSTPVTNNTTGTIYHTYASAGKFVGSVTVTSSADRTSTESFRVYTGSLNPTAAISVNDTKVQTASNNVRYLIVNWSAALQLNATNSTSTLFAGAPVSGLITDAMFNITNYGGGSTVYNYSRSSGADPFSNATMTFLGGGSYLTQGWAAKGVPISGWSLGWQYNVTLTVWDAGGHNATTTLVILVKDTQKPTPSLTLKDQNGTVIPMAGVVEGSNFTHYVKFSFANSTDPNNGSILWYNLTITNAKNTSVNQTTFHQISTEAVAPNYPVPAAVIRWLPAQAGAYTVNLTVTDRAGNKGWTVQSLLIAQSTNNRPVLLVENLTAPSTLTDGTSYAVWANVTNTVGANSTAQNVSVRFYILPPSGTGNQIDVGGTVTYWGYNATGALNSTPLTGDIKIAYNHTIRAEMSMNPARTGTWALWVNATASNEFVSNYASGLNQAHTTVTLNANPIVAYEEYGAIAAAVVVIILAIVFWTRWRGRPSKSTSGSGKLERGSSKKDKDDDDED